MADSTAFGPRSETLLQFLMRERHLTREQTLEVLDRRARRMGINDFAMSLRQLDRWLAREVGDPRAVRCRVAEAEFGHRIERLLAPVGDDADRSLADRRPAVLSGLEEAEQISRRIQRRAVSNVDQSTIEQIRSMIEGVGSAYERSDAGSVYPSALRQRQWIEELLSGSQPLRMRIELYVLAGQASAVLGYLAFDRGDTATANAYCGEAVQLAQEAGHHDLLAWVRNVQSFMAYYDGRYGEALDLARDGQRWAAGGRQSVRLAACGEARALGKLGDRDGVDRAVDFAISRRGALPEGDPVGCFLSFEVLGSARLFGNAATAYLSVSDHQQVDELGRLAVATFSERAARPSQCLTLLDMAVAQLTPGGDPEAAAEALGAAVEVGGDLSSEVVCRRARQVLGVTSRSKDVPQIAAMTERILSWRPLQELSTGTSPRWEASASDYRRTRRR